ncbi:hypothetical protein FGB62_37g418 [Gracilaria domingensis]|nr:hypothetical protein FGB62_37g418 [Gracilaria domingensis]
MRLSGGAVGGGGVGSGGRGRYEAGGARGGLVAHDWQLEGNDFATGGGEQNMTDGRQPGGRGYGEANVTQLEVEHGHATACGQARVA